jgi:hypothetical protein
MRAGLVVLLIGCQHDAAPAPPPIQNGILMEAPDPHCRDAPMSAGPAVETGYLIGPDELVSRTMRDHRFEFQRCILHRRQYDTSVGGKLVLQIHLDAAGHPTLVETRGPDAELDRCVCAAVLKLTFGLVSSTVTYPLYFGD